MKIEVAIKMLRIFLLALLFNIPPARGLSYVRLEQLITKIDNVETLEESFYPINSHRKNIVSITYKFILPLEVNTIPELHDYLNDHSGICFHWLSSPVHLSINKEMLHGLSLRAYIPEVSNATLQINLNNLSFGDILGLYEDLKQIDELIDDNDTNTLCKRKGGLLDVLNNFTGNAHMYALGKKKIFDQEIHPEDRGYSVYYYQPNTSSKYCVLYHEDAYVNQRYLLNFGSLLVIIFAVLGFPLLFVELYKPFINILKGPSGSEYWKFITWSIVVVSFVANCLVLTNNAFVLARFVGQYDSSSFDILIFIFAFSAFCFGGWILDFVGCVFAIAYMDRSEGGFRKELDLPVLITTFLKLIGCWCDEDHSIGEERGNNKHHCCCKCIAVALGYTIIVHFLQLISFHVVYIMLGAIAAPSETLSIFFSFITAYVFAVIYVAIIFKYLSKKHFEEDKEYLNFVLCIVPLSIAGIALIMSIALFTVFFYKFTIVMEITSRSEGLWGLVKSFLPALFVAFLGFCGHKLLKYIKRTSESTLEPDGQTGEGTSQDPQTGEGTAPGSQTGEGTAPGSQTGEGPQTRGETAGQGPLASPSQQQCGASGQGSQPQRSASYGSQKGENSPSSRNKRAAKAHHSSGSLETDRLIKSL